jgi:hypothetical protein
MKIIQDNQHLEITIHASKSPISMVLSGITGILMALGAILALYAIENQKDASILFAFVFFCISFGYIDTCFWHIKGIEIVSLNSLKATFQTRSIITRKELSLEIADMSKFKLYDPATDPEDLKPRRDVPNGKIILFYTDKTVTNFQRYWGATDDSFFRFGGNLTVTEAQEIVDNLNHFLSNQKRNR